MENFDIIISGAGPAGLTAAVELAKDFNILLIEKNKPGTTSATWYSYADRAIDYGLEEAVAMKTDFIKFSSPEQTHYMHDDCVVFDHNKVLQIWLKKAKNSGVVIRQEEFTGYENKDDGVIIETKRNKYFAHLLIDAMGINSPVIRQNKLIKRKDAWVIFGARIRTKKPERSFQLEYYPLNDEKNTYVGIHPIGNNETNIYVFQGQKDTLGEPGKLRAVFEKVIEETLSDSEKIETLQGSIVSGELYQYALDHIIFFGSSGMLNPDGCGMGFNEILKQHRVFSAEIKKSYLSGKLDQHSLSKIAGKIRDQEVVHFQKIIGAFSLHFIRSAGKWDGGVKWLNAMGEDSKKWMRNEMDLEWLKKANINLHRAIPLKETIKMIPFNELPFIMGQLIRFTNKTLVSKIKNGIKLNSNNF